MPLYFFLILFILYDFTFSKFNEYSYQRLYSELRSGFSSYKSLALDVQKVNAYGTMKEVKNSTNKRTQY
uniref:Putative ovule protein n=1 Tax=Solanum chacoense TaxID=4108 RepID=A0A0V0IAB0_SOLCH